MNEFPGGDRPPIGQEWEQPAPQQQQGPPIPPPSPYSCPKCGLQMQAPMPYCARCGARLDGQAAGTSCLAIGGAICLGMLALPSALLGGCLVLFGAVEPGSDQGALVGFGLLGAAFAALCIWGMVRLLRGRRG